MGDYTMGDYFDGNQTNPFYTDFRTKNSIKKSGGKTDIAVKAETMGKAGKTGKAGRTGRNGTAWKLLLALCVMLVTVFGQLQVVSASSSEQEQNQQDDEWNMDLNVLTPVGNDYCDFYTPRFIRTEDYYFGDEYKEFCVIDCEPLVGTASTPVLPDKNYFLSYFSTYQALTYTLDLSMLSCGFFAGYADPDPDSNFGENLDYVHPPLSAKQDTFFNGIRDAYTKKSEGDVFTVYNEFNELKFSNIKRKEVQGRDLTYMEITYKTHTGVEIIDVVSYEKKQEGYAFITEYRFPKSKISNGEEAIQKAYSMLTFYTEDFESIDAGGTYWTESRIYNEDNTHSVRIKVSDFMDVWGSNMTSKREVTFSEYTDDRTIFVCLSYDLFNYLERYDSFDEYIKAQLELYSSDEYYQNAKENERKQFSYEGQEVYYCSYVYEYKNAFLENADPDKHMIMEYLIETPDKEEIRLLLEFTNTVPKDFDPVKFLQDHITLE